MATLTRSLSIALLAILIPNAPCFSQDVLPESARSLAAAVAVFNAQAADDQVGRSQPPLTEEEVVAAIRGWIREQHPVSDEFYASFQRIAETRQLPDGAKLSSTNRWTGFRGFDFDVWWVDLTIRTGKNRGYNFRIRDQKIGSERHTDELDGSLTFDLFVASPSSEAPGNDSNPTGHADSPVGFVLPGRDYAIRFPETVKLFRSTKTEVTQSKFQSADGPTKPGSPATWTIQTEVTIFRVLQLGAGSWAQVEHPTKTDDYLAWQMKKLAQAYLTPERVAEMQGDPDQANKLAKKQELASQEIATTKTWINLAQAIAIADVPSEPPTGSVSVTMSPVGKN